MFKQCFVALCFSVLPLSVSAEVENLPLHADYCAIKRAMTGKTDSNCPVREAPGIPRSYSQNAAPLDSVSSAQGYYIHFAFGSDDLTPDYQAHLSRLSDVLSSSDLANLCLKLVGHTDAVGSAQFNDVLSQRRARTVRLYLVGAMNFDGGRIITDGVGESELLPDISGEDPRNRRVEILARDPENGACI
ncbi:MAG: OmpA family protein [Pseudomonadota bacterium]